eukprot:SAG22_NODE_600_length_8677_cov_18.222429_1_plen_111_part_10
MVAPCQWVIAAATRACSPAPAMTSFRPVLVLLLLLSGRIDPAAGLNNGLALTPPQAWTSWNLCRFEVNATLIKEVAAALNSSGLQALGWDTLQIDEGWEACADYGHYYGFE